MKITQLYKEFFNSEKAGGLILIICTAVSLILANSGIAAQYLHFWHTDIAGHSLTHWINDGLMTLFFLLIGLELEREIYEGELSNIKDALLPIFAAIGGMIFPAGLYYLLNYNYDTLSGAGIPTATDIAFALGVLSLLGSRVPGSLKIFLTALAVIDDLGAIIVISVFYTQAFAASYLFLSLGVFVILLILNRLNVKNLLVYLAGGVVMWYFMMHSGVHPTISGVLLAFVIPFREIGKSSPSYVLQHFLHKPVAFLILPVFALANTAIALESGLAETLTSHYGLGISLGLIVGKPLGIFLLSWITVSVGITKLPADVKWLSVAGVGFLGGIGFTMSIFITLLAFDSEAIINNAKLVILLSSLVAGIIGYLILKLSLKGRSANEE
jgi:NhaA family Na+:H+ antiporter